MKRFQFVKRLGIMAAMPFGLGAIDLTSAGESRAVKGGCALVPSESAGPFPLDLTSNVYYFRQDIREDRLGIPLRQKIRVVGLEDCEPMANIRVNIWHCDAEGNYSGYGTEAGTTYLRGYQLTDANGECEFLTIFPGWYPGRTTHVHFQVHVSTAYSAVSQWTWSAADAQEPTMTHPALYPEGPDPLPPTSDMFFSDGFDLQTADLLWDEASGEYVSQYNVTVESAGFNGVGHLERMTAKVIEVQQNAPNPFVEKTQITFVLHEPAALKWSLWSVSGDCIFQEDLGSFPAGNHQIDINGSRFGLSASTYLYQLNATTMRDTYTVVKRMTPEPG
jgi:hypothetical protein